MSRSTIPTVFIALTLTACGGGSPSADSTSSGAGGASLSSASRVSHGSAESTSGAGGAGGASGSTGSGPMNLVCDALGLPAAPFAAGPYGGARGNLAGDFTLPTLAGDWGFKANFTGCETLVVIPDVTPYTQAFSKGLWAADAAALLAKSPNNVHYAFVVTSSSDAATAKNRVSALKDTLDAALAARPEGERASWARRLHYVSKPQAALTGWVGALLKSPGVGFGVDRFQRIRELGSPSDPSRYDQSKGWFAPNLSFIAYEARAYEFAWKRQAALAAEKQVLVIPVFDDKTATATHEGDASFPDPETMKLFDTMEFDLSLGCEPGPEASACPKWDYITRLTLCDVADVTRCDTEVGRFITPYAREGRWVTDESPMLALLAGGGTRRIRWNSQNAYRVKLDIRLSNGGKGSSPKEAVFLFAGGDFNATYNDHYAPKTVAIPADAKRVELYATVTGHGWGAEVENCAEFCAHEHHFAVNGKEYVKTNPAAGSETGCVDAVDQGALPNQFGTWFYGRGGWCPGLDVAPWVVDVTSQVKKGQDNVFTYKGLLRGAPYAPKPSGSGQGFGANIDMVSYVIVSR
jgi:Peptide-N-glycosidase F, C terminal